MNPSIAIISIAALRIMTSWNWINGAFFGTDSKASPDWLSGEGLLERISGPDGFAAKALYPFVGDFIRDIMTQNPCFWAWFIFLVYAIAGISLFLGLFTRLGGLVAILAGIMNILAAGGNGADTIGQNALLLILGAIFMITGAGRFMGLDQLLLTKCHVRWLKYLS